MRSNDVIYFLTPETYTDELGQTRQTGIFTERMVFANEFTVSAGEFYSASSAGLKPEKQFEIYSFEYDGEGLLKHEGQTYTVIRTQKKGEKMRVTCEKDVGQ